MRTIITGSPSITDRKVMQWAMRQVRFLITEVLSAEQTAVDRFGEEWAAQHQVPVVRFGSHIMRDRDRVQNADALLALWDGEDEAMYSLVRLANEHGLLTEIVLTHPDLDRGGML